MVLFLHFQIINCKYIIKDLSYTVQHRLIYVKGNDMNRGIDILQTIVPVVIVLAIGVILRRRQLLSRNAVNALKSIVVNITLPAVLLSAFASTSYSPKDILIPVSMKHLQKSVFTAVWVQIP